MHLPSHHAFMAVCVWVDIRSFGVFKGTFAILCWWHSEILDVLWFLIPSFALHEAVHGSLKVRAYGTAPAGDGGRTSSYHQWYVSVFVSQRSFGKQRKRKKGNLTGREKIKADKERQWTREIIEMRKTTVRKQDETSLQFEYSIADRRKTKKHKKLINLQLSRESLADVSQAHMNIK